MNMEPGSKQEDSGVVNITRAIEALSPWLNNPRRTIFKVEVLVLVAAALLFLQIILGSCRRRWHNCFIKYLLQASTTVMNPLIIYTLGMMQSSPIKNSSYPVWAAFLVMASAGTSVVRQYDFCGSLLNKYMQIVGEGFRDVFYLTMFALLLDPNTYKSAWDLKGSGTDKASTASSNCVFALVVVVAATKYAVAPSLVILGYKSNIQQGSRLAMMIEMIHRTIAAVCREETTANDGASDSCPQSMKGYEYLVSYRLCGGFITIDQIWDSCGNSADDGNALKDLCLSCALSQRLLRQQYFGRMVYHLKDHDFVFKKLLSSEGGFKRAFRVIEVELGFCYDFFFTKYYYTFEWMSFLPGSFIISLILLKIILILILMVGVFAIRKSLVLETPNPIMQVGISEADYIVTILVLGIALLVDLVHAMSYLASNWAQPDPVEVSDAVKEAIATSLKSTYGSNLATSGETSVRLLQNQMLGQYSWALKDLSQLEVMLIWHIATEYCDISDDPSNENGSNPGSNHRGAHLFGYVLQLLRPDPRRHMIAQDSHRGVAVHLSRYCAYLIVSVPELLPYQESDIAELADEVMDDRMELSGFFYRLSEIYNKLKNLGGTEEEDDPRTMFQKGVKLGKQLERMPDVDRWEVLEDFWAEMIIHAAASHYTTKQHMQHLENGGQFLTHIWALLAHAGILNINRNKDQEDQANPGSGHSAAT